MHFRYLGSATRKFDRLDHGGPGVRVARNPYRDLQTKDENVIMLMLRLRFGQKRLNAELTGRRRRADFRARPA
jgi:hypothetical protein